MRNKKYIFVSILLGIFLLGTLIEKSFASISCEIVPNYIPIHFFYSGKDVEIFGHSDQKADVVIVIQDKAEELHLRKKGKVKGLFWMNVGELTFEPVPIVFMVFSNKPLDQILDKTEQAKYGIGYAALFKEVKIKPDPGPDRNRWIKEFIKFKEHHHLYREKFNSIKIEPEGPSYKYQLHFHWPFQAPPDVYTVTVYAIKDGKVVGSCKKKIKIEKVGLLKTISDMALERPALYGIIAIIIAIVAGIGVGLIFGGKSKH
ncbi:TIGR02186 family protein [Thermodesulfatator atlanticus]|uniref:TIGR02186 family protein n=1 Tax=Thermodesulfatator atlanticus TaxID=501497 RepID=UPI0003B2E5B0|nr:TIGR02186 family protein [Thermodesulfatator atlanticus]